MSQIIIMPKQGLQMTEGTISSWFVQEGQEVKEGHPLFEMETDKLSITIDASCSGTMLKILCPEGEVAEVAAPIAVVGAPGEDYSAVLNGSTVAAAEPAPEASTTFPASASTNGTIVIMPKQGLQMTEGMISTWLVQEGQEVKEGQPLFEMETDKLSITIDASASGTLLKILCDEGEVAEVAAPIAVIGEPGADYQAILNGTSVNATEPQPAPVPATQSTTHSSTQVETPAVSCVERTFSSPRARTRAEELGIDFKAIPGSGPMGMVLERDVLNAKSMMKTVEQVTAPTGAKQVPISGMRRVIAQRMMDSLNTLAQANHRLTVDMSAAVALREQLKAAGVKVSYNDIVIRCVAKALTEFPMVNATMDDKFITLYDHVNIGVAVATDTGLLVPVIRNADKLSLPQIAVMSKDLAARTKENKLSPDELTGGTFTISNLGMFDIESFTAIINKPEAGILAVGKMEKQPVVINDQIVIRPRMQLSLTYDHRILDGAPAALFLRRVKQLLENPGLLI